MIANKEPQAQDLGQSVDVESGDKSTTSSPQLNRMNPAKSQPYATTREQELREAQEAVQFQKRRDLAALRLAPMSCGCHDPLFHRCTRTGAR